MRFSVIFSKNLPRLLKKAKNFLLKSSVQRWEAASVVPLVNTVRGLISRLIGGKMPGGFNSSAIKSYLSKSWGLCSSRSDGVLLLGTTLKPPKRLASKAEGKSWLDGVVSVYAQRSGISLTSPDTGGASRGGGGGAVINSEEFLKFQSDQQTFAAQHVELYMRYLGRDSRAGEVAFDQEKTTSLALQAKLDQYHLQAQRCLY